MTNSKSSTQSSSRPSSRETSYFEGTLDFKWPSIMSGLNTRTPQEGNKAPIFKDTVFVKILEDGSLHQRKIIQKPLGSAKFLETLLAPFNISYPKVTNVVEDTIINRENKTCWMFSRNLQVIWWKKKNRVNFSQDNCAYLHGQDGIWMARNLRKSHLHRRTLAPGKTYLCIQENGGEFVLEWEA